MLAHESLRECWWIGSVSTRREGDFAAVRADCSELDSYEVGLVLSWSRNIWYDKMMWLGLKAFLELLPRPFLELGVGIES